VPLKMHELRELIRLVDESQIEEFELENDGTKVVIKKGLSGQVEVVAPAVASAPVQAPQAPQPAPAAQPAPQPSAEAQAAAPAQGEAEEDDSQYHKIVSPMVGTFYRAPAPDADPYVQPGDRVDEKTVVCIVEAMKLMNEIEAEVRGEIVKVLVENGQLVEYGQPLFLVKPE
jgi:acetyl-CoA carboxylase biotin carboxyl carrier protein